MFALNSAPSKHKQKVANIQKQVRDYQTKGEGKGMCTARPGWQTISPQNMEYKNKMYPINVSRIMDMSMNLMLSTIHIHSKVNLVDILEINTERRTLTCEPLVTMGQLTASLDHLGWTIPIVPELDDLTVGRFYNGLGGVQSMGVELVKQKKDFNFGCR